MSMVRFITSPSGVRIALESGGEGPPLLLIHGTGARRGLWTPVRRGLEAHFTVHAMDRRGHGDSGDSPDYTFEHECEDVIHCVHALGSEPVSVAAHSFGALCALGAARMGAGIAKLILYEPPVPMIAQAYFPATLTSAMREALDRDDRSEAVCLFLSGVLDMKPDRIAALRRVSAWKDQMALAPIIWRELQAVETCCPNLWDYASWSIPAMLLVGQKSPGQYQATVAALNARLPGSRIEMLPGQAHGAIIAAPAMVAAVVTRFLRDDQPN